MPPTTRGAGFRFGITAATAVSFWCQPALAGDVKMRKQSTSAVSLREAVSNRFLIGAAIMSARLDESPQAAMLARQFSSLTAENELKPRRLQPEPGHFDFAAGDRLAAFASAHGMKVIGHTLCWHGAEPAWMFAGADGRPLPREQALANLETHIQTVMKHYRGKVLGWDVVNEALSDRGDEYLRDTPAHKAIGDDYVEKAFEFARAADPGAQLYYNDYAIESVPKRDKAVRLLRSLKAKGLRVDAIGIQGHWHMDSLDPAGIEQAITEFQGEGVNVMITELDLDVLPGRSGGADVNQAAGMRPELDPYAAGCPPAVLARQAQCYAELFRLFLRHRDVITRVTFWGADDGHSWLNNWPVKGRTNHALLFDRQLRPKPAADAVADVLQGSNPGGSAAVPTT